ncbi:MAG: secondary thiamine-phosphate synthase enzyme YjbQ [Pseudomonadota bacterium]
MPMHSFTVQTSGQGLYEFTDHANRFVAGIGGDGLLTVFVRHTSCSILIQENADPDVRHDLQAWLSRLVPPSDSPAMAYLKHTMEGPDDMPAHIKAAVMQTSIGIPVSEGRPMLGTWQGIYLFEHRDAPHKRQIALHYVKG